MPPVTALSLYRAVAPGLRSVDMATSNVPDPAILAEVVRRIVEVAHPDRIVLFGSAARGQMGPDSDSICSSSSRVCPTEGGSCSRYTGGYSV